ncbi:MAG TPA: hypothetical protein VHB25_04985 [Gemmatimonadaceae bacterium]|nr:hypothetical protein [Gemmatimonadaceae bacterium]
MREPESSERRPGDDGGQYPADRYRDPEAELGGADAVEKTTYVTGEGTSPEARHPRDQPAANVPSNPGRNAFFWIVLVVVVLLVIAYVGGLFR